MISVAKNYQHLTLTQVGLINNMKEIKFRAWNKEWKCMKPIAKLTFECDVQSLMVYNDATDGYGNVSIYEEWEDCCIGDDVMLMQFTGLKDKNGKEIYEGDIIEYSNWNEEKQSQYTIILIDNITKLPNIDYEYGKVIGNIYENPELLK